LAPFTEAQNISNLRHREMKKARAMAAAHSVINGVFQQVERQEAAGGGARVQQLPADPIALSSSRNSRGQPALCSSGSKLPLSRGQQRRYQPPPPPPMFLDRAFERE
jgi:hypothetical protein